MRCRIASFAAVALMLAAPARAAALAETEGSNPDHKVEITQLKRTGDNLMLRFTMSNAADKKLDFSYDYGDGTGDFNSIGAVHLLDTANKKKYLVVRDDKNTCVCSRGLKGIEAGKSLNLWARFPAPPDGVEKITVVIPHFPPLDDVPISK